MAQHDVIILKGNKHTPAEAGDTIDHKLLPISAEPGNGLEAKDDGLFMATPTGGGAANISLVRNPKSIANVQGKNFSVYGKAHEYVFTNAAGEEKKFLESYSNPIFYELNVEGDSRYGLQTLYLVPWILNLENNEASLGTYINLPNAVLDTPEITGTTLKIKMKHRSGGEDVSRSTQTVSVDLADVLGTKLTETQDVPNGTTGSDIPTAFIGAAREKLLAAPDKWLEVTINGERGVVPWFKLP